MAISSTIDNGDGRVITVTGGAGQSVTLQPAVGVEVIRVVNSASGSVTVRPMPGKRLNGTRNQTVTVPAGESRTFKGNAGGWVMLENAASLDGSFLQVANNLSEVTPATARTNLELGMAATKTPAQLAADSAFTGIFAPLVLANAALTAANALAERDALTGVVPPRMTTAPTVIGPTKGSGVTGTPTVAAGGSGYVVGDTITLAGGTALSAAILKVATLSGSAVATVTVYRNGSYTATPSNAVAQDTTSGVGTGATFNVSWSANGQSTSLNRQTIAPTDNRFRFTGNGPTNLSASGFYGNTTGNGTHTSWEWSTDSQRVDIPMIGLNSQAILYVDGRQVSASGLSVDSSGTQYLYALDFGSSSWRSFRLVGYNLAFGGVRLDGTATLAAPFRQDRPLWWTLGDSYTAGSFSENAGSTHIQVMGDILGVDVISDGVGGTAWGSAAGNVPATRITTKLNVLTRQVDYVSFDLGLNDAGGDMTAAAAAFDAAVTAAKASPAVKVTTKYFAFGPATPVGTTSNLDAVRTMLIARCAANGVAFIDVRDWVNATNKAVYTNGDNTHPVAAGHKYLGARRALAVRPYL